MSEFYKICLPLSITQFLEFLTLTTIVSLQYIEIIIEAVIAPTEKIISYALARIALEIISKPAFKYLNIFLGAIKYCTAQNVIQQRELSLTKHHVLAFLCQI